MANAMKPQYNYTVQSNLVSPTVAVAGEYVGLMNLSDCRTQVYE